MRTPHRAWCETRLGTEPRTRRAPAIPRLPTTIICACSSSATLISSSAGSPSHTWVVTWIPFRLRRALVRSTISCAARRACPSSTTPGTVMAAAPIHAPDETDEYALTTCTWAPRARASSAALSTASSAFADPSVPATIGSLDISSTPRVTSAPTDRAHDRADASRAGLAAGILWCESRGRRKPSGGDPGVRPRGRVHVASAAVWEPIPDDGLRPQP